MPGGELTYSIWVWSTLATQRMTVQARSTGKGAWPPRFTLCPAARHRVCSVGPLGAGQAVELLVRVHVGLPATAGEQITLIVTVQAPDLSPAQASVAVLVGQAMPSPTPPATGSGLPPISYPPLPGTTVPPSNLSTLFPVVTPSASARHARRQRAVSVAPASSTLPLDPRLIGGQLAGLAILAAAIAMAVARVSLRPAAPKPGANPEETAEDPGRAGG